MKTRLFLRTMGLLIMTASLFVISSCSKTADGNLSKEQQDKNLEASLVDERDFTESDEDLTTVDYKEFYDQLSAHGEWVQVMPEDIGLQSKTAMFNSSGNSTFSVSSLLGIKDAYAGSEVSAGMVYVWKPSADLGVTMDAGETPVYTPYTNGQWVNTDAGWYFKAATPVEETVSHYGRWVNSPTAGWLWVPGRVWAPAWVDWKQNDSYVAWAPIPPSVYIVNNNIDVPPIDEDRYVIVEKKYFVQPQIYKYMYKENKNKIMIKEMTRTDGVMIMNKIIINKGPEVADIEKYWGNNIQIVKVSRVKIKNNEKYSDKEYYVYTPGFQRYKSKENKRFTVNEPKSYKKYNEWKIRKSEEKEYKKEEKEYKKEDKEYKNENKNNDNGKKYNGSNGKKNNGNDNKKKQKENDNGKKYNNKHDGKNNDGTKNGNKNNGNNKGKGKK